MKAFKVIVLVIACLIVAPMLLALCFPAPVLAGDVLKVATTTFPTKLNPYAGNSASETFISGLLYEPVFGWNLETKWYDNTGLGDFDSLKIQKNGSDGFEKVTKKVNGKDVTAYKMSFKVKDTAYWSDGEKVTAADIVYTYDYIQSISNSAFPIQRNFIQQSVIPGVPFDEETGDYGQAYGYEVDPNDSQKVILYLNLPSSDLVRTLFTSIMVIPKKAWSEAVAGLDNHANFPNLKPVGCGPYKLVRFSAGQNAMFERNPGYHTPSNYGPEEVFVRYIGEISNAIKEVSNGTYDALLDAVPASEAFNYSEHKESYGAKMGLYQSSAPSVSTLLINTRRHPSPLFREALSLVIDQDELISSQLHGYGSKAGPCVTMDPQIIGEPNSTENPIYDNPFASVGGVKLKVSEPVPVNVERAVAMMATFMASEGYTKGAGEDFYTKVIDGVKTNFQFKVYTKVENSSTINLKVKLGAMMKKVGIELVQKNMPPNSSDSFLKPGGAVDSDGWDGYIWGANISADNYTVTYAYQFLMDHDAKGVAKLPSSTFNYGSFDGDIYTSANVSSWYGGSQLESEYLKISQLNDKINAFVTMPTATEKITNAKEIQQLLCGTYYKIPLYSADFLYFYNEARFEGFTKVTFESMFNTQTFKNLHYIGEVE